MVVWAGSMKVSRWEEIRSGSCMQGAVVQLLPTSLMLRTLSSFCGMPVFATDGRLGDVTEVLIDLDHFVSRYLVVRGNGRRDYIFPPMALGWPEGATDGRLDLRLAADLAHSSPCISDPGRLLAEDEAALFDHYDYPPYWGGPYLWGNAVIPTDHAHQIFLGAPNGRRGEPRHLRASEFVRYTVQDREGIFGIGDDVLVDCEDWSIQYFIVTRENRLRYWKALIPAYYLRRWDTVERQLTFDITRVRVETTQEYRPGQLPPSPERLVRARCVMST